MKCAYCKTEQVKTHDPKKRMTFITCKCPGLVLVEVWIDDDIIDALEET